VEDEPEVADVLVLDDDDSLEKVEGAPGPISPCDTHWVVEGVGDETGDEPDVAV
jgi:hypothetical protein